MLAKNQPAGGMRRNWRTRFHSASNDRAGEAKGLPPPGRPFQPANSMRSQQVMQSDVPEQTLTADLNSRPVPADAIEAPHALSRRPRAL